MARDTSCLVLSDLSRVYHKNKKLIINCCDPEWGYYQCCIDFLRKYLELKGSNNAFVESIILVLRRLILTSSAVIRYVFC